MEKSFAIPDSLQRLLVSNVELGKEISRGSFWCVFEATCKQGVVAVKRIHSTEVDKEKLLKECERSAQLSHANIVRFVGIHWPSPGRVADIVVERLRCSLTKQLEETRAAAAAGDQFPVDKKLSILSQVGRGLRYLHSQSPPIIHCNLSSDNVLLSEKLELAKITDLGSVQLVDPKKQLEIMKAPNMVVFMPPEVLSDELVQYGAEVDMFSFGCVMLHTLSHQWPTPSQPVGFQSEVDRRQKYFDIIVRQEVLKVEQSRSVKMMKRCLSNSSNDRPSIVSMCDCLICMRGNLPGIVYVGSIKRIRKELLTILSDPLPSLSVSPVDDNLQNWTATIKGPADTPYEGGVFRLHIMFPMEYPFKPPKITFRTKIYHPNIGSTAGVNFGHISLDMLCFNWSPTYFMPKVLLAIISLLADPNADEPLEPEIARVYKNDINKFNDTAKQWTQQYTV